MSSGFLGGTGCQRAVAEARRYAKSREPIVILGEAGTGKTALAEAIHGWSGATGQFVRFPLSGIGEEIAIASLVGHAKGAYTGAVTDEPGLLAEAAGGTLLLDELNGASASLQVGLLPLLDGRPVRRIGGGRPILNTARILGATNGDLAAEVRAGRFRADLLDRFGVIRITLPSLRDRREDVIPMFRAFLTRLGLGEVHLDTAVYQLLESYSWPGNVRELERVAGATACVMRANAVTLADLPTTLLEGAFVSDTGLIDWRERARQALERAGGNKAKAARMLGVSRSRFYRSGPAKERDSSRPFSTAFEPVRPVPTAPTGLGTVSNGGGRA